MFGDAPLRYHMLDKPGEEPMPDGSGKFVSMTQWGALDVSVREGRVVGVSPFEGDPDPSPILNAVPESLYHESRIARPAIRRGFLEKTTGGTARGAEPFVEVSWDDALALVANELARVKAEWGNEAIFTHISWISSLCLLLCLLSHVKLFL